MSYLGPERREENKQMSEDIAVLKEQMCSTKGKLETLDEDMRSLNNQLVTLVAQIPNLIISIDNLNIRIDSHENNAITRQKEYGTCRDARIVATNSIKWLWLIISVILLTNIGMLIHLMASATNKK